jgi:hypothetical protein
MSHSTTLSQSVRSPRATPACSAGRGPWLAPLTPTQLVVLSEAVRRSDGGVALPERLKGKAAEKLVQALLGRGLVRKVPAKAGLPVWRRDEETGRAFALVLSKRGRAAVPTEDPGPERTATEKTGSQPTGAASHRGATIGIEAKPVPGTTEAKPQQGSAAEDVDAGDRPNTLAPRPGSKLDAVTALLGRDEGASVDEIMAATGWLPHTTRAALTGLRKRGFAITRGRTDDGGSRYRIETVLPRAA